LASFADVKMDAMAVGSDRGYKPAGKTGGDTRKGKDFTSDARLGDAGEPADRLLLQRACCRRSQASQARMPALGEISRPPKLDRPFALIMSD
jgi:hypothetical protein